MCQAKTFNVSLTSELQGFVASHVAFSRFGTASEVVRTALRPFEREETAQAVSRPARGQAAKQ